MNVIECDGLIKKFGRLKAVNNLSFNIEENKITGLIGRNGAGKTTLLKILAGFLRPSSGNVKVFSENPFNSINVSEKTIFVDDNMVFPATLSLAEVLKEAGRFYKDWDAKLALGLFDYFSLNPRQHHSNLSKGMKSTFNMIIGIASRCPLTIFDEPTTGMDAAVRKDFYRALLKDYVEHPRTIILSSHLLNEIEDILEDIMLIKDGTKCLHMPVLDLKEYAVGVRGKAEAVNGLAATCEIFHHETIGKDSIYVVIKNNLDTQKRQIAKMSGVEISPVNTSDLCVYMTAKTKGGIDGVFNKQ